MTLVSLGIITGLKAEADILSPFGFLIESCGGHQVETAAAIKRLIDKGANHLVSFGIAGGLSPNLKSGDLVFPQEVILPDGRVVKTSPLPGLSPSSLRGRIAGIDAPILTASAKKQLFLKTGALAVDTESHMVAQSGMPFSVIRAIADQAGDDLPSAILQGLDKKGRALLGPVLLSLIKDPRQLPGLIRAGYATKKALRALFGCRSALFAPDTL